MASSSFTTVRLSSVVLPEHGPEQRQDKRCVGHLPWLDRLLQRAQPKVRSNPAVLLPVAHVLDPGDQAGGELGLSSTVAIIALNSPVRTGCRRSWSRPSRSPLRTASHDCESRLSPWLWPIRSKVAARCRSAGGCPAMLNRDARPPATAREHCPYCASLHWTFSVIYPAQVKSRSATARWHTRVCALSNRLPRRPGLA